MIISTNQETNYNKTLERYNLNIFSIKYKKIITIARYYGNKLKNLIIRENQKRIQK